MKITLIFEWFDTDNNLMVTSEPMVDDYNRIGAAWHKFCDACEALGGTPNQMIVVPAVNQEPHAGPITFNTSRDKEVRAA